jgi:hypothetical protein
MRPGNMKYEDWMNKNGRDYEELEANQYVKAQRSLEHRLTVKRFHTM